MCGRYALASDQQTLQQAFDLATVPDWQPRYNIAPTQAVPIITQQQPDVLTLVQWGLIPSWAKDHKIGYKLINARAETADSKPSFRAAFQRRRCLIPATGFYEWTTTEGGKQPHYIHLRDQDVFAFAGLWEVWHSPHGDTIQTCTILTGEPNTKVKAYHHRMAIILPRTAYAMWLDDASARDELKQVLLSPYPDDAMDIHPVSKAVNTPKHDHPSLIERHDPPQQLTMF